MTAGILIIIDFSFYAFLRILPVNKTEMVTTPTTDTYIPDEIYDAILDKLTRCIEDPMKHVGVDTRYSIIEILSDFGSVWPASVLEDHATAIQQN